MKTKTYIIAILLAGGLINSHAQDTWTQKADFGGIARFGAAGFAIGSKGYLGTGNDYNNRYNDLWEYDTSTDAWVQKAGTAVVSWVRVGFSIGSKGYIGTGWDGSYTNTFFEYDSATNAWTQKANFRGTARQYAVGFAIGSKGYIGTGYDGLPNFTKDFWEYDPSTNVWTQKADFGGTARANAVGFSIGSKGYIGTGNDDVSFYRDFWEYDPSTNAWTQKADFGGTARTRAVGFVISSKGYLGTGNDDLNGNGFRKDFWEYDPAANTWTQKADFGGTARFFATGFSIGSKGYIGTGWDLVVNYKDFWEYTPGDLPVVMLSTTNLTFGAQLDGTRSAAQSVTLTNSGAVTLNISSIAASADFLQKNNCGSSVPAGASCTIKVAFKPSAKGVLTGNVTITDDAADSPQTIALTGTGTVVQVSPPALDFGDQTVGTTSDPQTATITNTGSVALHISGVAIKGTHFADFAETSTCGTKLAAGESCAVNVTFTPTAKRDRHAALLIVDDGGDSPQPVHLTGTGL